MTLDEMARTTSAWLRGDGPLSDVVISSRVRLARNLADFPFLTTASETDRTEIYRQLVDGITATSAGSDAMVVDIDAADPIEREILVERHLISRQLAAGEGRRGVTISRSETCALMINEEDHLRMQVLGGGLRLDELWQTVNDIDDDLASRHSFSYDSQYGFLTACPTNVGTGIRVSVMVHLPALRITKEIERVERAARDMRLAVRGIHGEGTEALGDLYQISNQVTLGVAEEEIIEAFGNRIIPKIVEYERTARKSLSQQGDSQLDDRIYRAYGVLTNARCITSEETQALLSPLRMGIHMGRFDQIDIATVNEVFLHAQPAHLQALHGRALDDDERDIVRADYLRERLAR